MAQPLVIPNNSAMFLDVANATDRELDHLLLTELERAPARVVVRDAGGCKGRIKDLMPLLFGFYANGCRYEENGTLYTFQGFRFSGGTNTNAVTNVPAYLARLYPCISGSTTPRTARMTASKTGVTVDSYGTGLATGQHSAAVIQENVKDVLTWSGDLRSYIRFMKLAMKHGSKGAVTVCNGGDISIDEALLAWLSGIPVVLLEGTERAADTLVTAFRAGNLEAEFLKSFDTDGRELSDELDRRDAVSKIDFPKLTRVAKFDDKLPDLGAESFARAQYELGLLTPVAA